MKLFLKALLILLAIPSLAFASPPIFESHQSIKQYASDFIDSKLNKTAGKFTIQIQDIDQRLKLKKCNNDIIIKLVSEPIKPGRNTLSVSCTPDSTWRIFMTAHVKLFTFVLISKRPLSKGHLIQKNDVLLKKINVTNLRSAYLTRPDTAINKVLKRRINEGSVISVNNLSEPILIKRGDSVTILAKTNGFEISMKGTALVNGGQGDKIKVRNTRTKKVIQATIVDKYTVNVNL